MARKALPNQLTLFDYKVDKPVLRKPTTTTNYKPLDAKIIYLVLFKNDIDVSHWSCPDYDVSETTEYLIQRGYTKILVFEPEEYWNKFKNGEFTLGKPS